MYQYAFEIVLCSVLLSAVEADLVGVAIILDHSYMHTLAVTCNVFFNNNNTSDDVHACQLLLS